ncbi:MAG TPA: hypothetical protein VFI91_12995 [Longimicrobiaceae bacterium]|nr:hypothetical protein [Longimicrobiaceae bacterium]
MIWLLLGVVALLGAAAPGVGQLPEAGSSPSSAATGVVPDTVTVGGRFRSVLRINTNSGTRVAAAALSTGDYLQLTDSIRVVQGSAGEWLIYYPMVAWRAGILPPARAAVTITAPDGETRRFETNLALPFVASVLPADTTGLQPCPHKGIVPVAQSSVPVWIPVIALAVLLAMAYLVWRFMTRRARGGASLEGSPRERALAALESPALRRLIDDNQPRLAAAYLADILRHLLAETDPRIGLHLTSDEVVQVMSSTGVAEPLVGSAGDILGKLDHVKFSDASASRDELALLLDNVRDLIVEWT